MNRKKPQKIFKIIVGLFLVAVINLSIVLGSNLLTNATSRPSIQGGYTASLYMSPSSGSYAGCTPQSISLYINTGGGISNAFDTKIYFNPSHIQVLDSNASRSGVQVATHPGYQSFVSNSVNNSSGIIQLAAASITTNVNGTFKLATINFQSKIPINSTSFTIAFTGIGSSTDSNIADHITSEDILGSVANGTYSFSQGSCSVTTPVPTATPAPTSAPTSVPTPTNIPQPTSTIIAPAPNNPKPPTSNSPEVEVPSPTSVNIPVNETENINLRFTLNANGSVAIDWPSDGENYEIYKNGTKIGESSSGEFTDFDTDDGKHLYSLVIDGNTISEVEVEISDSIIRLIDNSFTNILVNDETKSVDEIIELNQDDEIIFNGITLPDSEVEIYLGNNPDKPYTTRSDGNGFWEIIIDGSNMENNLVDFLIRINEINITNGTIRITNSSFNASSILTSFSLLLLILVILITLIKMIKDRMSFGEIIFNIRLVIFPVQEKSLDIIREPILKY